MFAMKSVRKAALAISVTALGLLAMGGTAMAGTVTAAGTVLTYTSAAGQADRLTIAQPSATEIVFDDVNAVVTGDGVTCVDGGGGDVLCTGAWTAVVANAGDGIDIIDAGAQGGYAGNAINVPITADGSTGDDTLWGGTAADTLNGGVGDDTLIGGLGADALNGGEDNDGLYGDDGNDALNGNEGDDRLYAGLGLDALVGGTGNDMLDGGATYSQSDTPDNYADDTSRSDGADTMDGGADVDTVSYEGRTAGVTVNLAVVAGNGEVGENDSVSNVENATGGQSGDTLVGNAEPNVLDGLQGADTLDGRDNFDQLFGGLDADKLRASSDVQADLYDCGSGFTKVATASVPIGTDTDTVTADYLDIANSTADCETVNRLAAPAGYPVTGTSGDDVLIGTRFADFMIGGLGNDTFRGGFGDDDLQGGAGNDKLYGFKGNDGLFGGNGSDALAGELGNDSLSGGGGSDTLNGGAGNDVLDGGIGVDKLIGGPGRDFLITRDVGRRADAVSCTKTKLRSQRDTVVADRNDKIANRKWCARILIG